jgi:IS30 family transposase
MKRYRQLSFSEREEIALLHAQGFGPTFIGRALGRSVSTISRELRRNCTAKGCYFATHAARKRLGRCRRPSLLCLDEKLRIFVIERLSEGWSPQCIAGWLGAGNESLQIISHETIYAFIYAAANKAEKLWRYLFQRKARRRSPTARRSKDRIAGRVSIHDRPQSIDERAEFGHWEADYMIFKNHQPLLVLHERKSKITLAAKLCGRGAAETISTLLAKFKAMAKGLRGSVTFDNDTGFALHHLLTSTLNIKTYFCDAYASWQKGGVENANGRLRYWLPKGMDLEQVSHQDIDDIILSYNLTPRRCLNWKTPLQVLAQSNNTELNLTFA